MATREDLERWQRENEATVFPDKMQRALFGEITALTARAERAEAERDAMQQRTTCARCLQHKHTPWRADDGYVCVACLGRSDARAARAEAAMRGLVAAVERVEWSAYQCANDMALCIECGEGHHDHPDGGGHKLECPLGKALRMAALALSPP